MELAPAVIGQMLVTGVLVGSIYGAVAMGFSLIFGVVRIVNFAHAGGVVWAMYAVFLVASSGVAGPYLATALVIPVFFGLGYVLQRALMVRIADMTEEMHIVFTFGLLLVLTYLAQFAFGTTSGSWPRPTATWTGAASWSSGRSSWAAGSRPWARWACTWPWPGRGSARPSGRVPTTGVARS